MGHDWLISLEIMCKLNQINNTAYNVGFTKLLRYKEEIDNTDKIVWIMVVVEWSSAE